MQCEPSGFEILRASLAFRILGETVYRDYAYRLPINGDEAVLDFGCGLGAVAYYAAGRLQGRFLTCVDASARWIEACRRTLRHRTDVTYLQDVRALPAASFGLIYCHLALHRIPDEDLAGVIPELSRLLRPKGLFAFREPLRRAKEAIVVQRLAVESGLVRADSRITDAPLVGSTIESIYARPL